ncbi:MAG: hypothetical protein ACI80V_002049 [Rhodothermales bacterium]
MTRLFTYALLPVLLMMVQGCSSRGGGKGEAAVPADFFVSVGKGGGFTGLWEGYRVTADGSVFRWKGRGPLALADSVGQMGTEAVGQIWQMAQDEGMLVRTDSIAGNMTGYIRLEADSQAVELRWPSTVGELASPSPLERFYSFVLDLAVSVQDG